MLSLGFEPIDPLDDRIDFRDGIRVGLDIAQSVEQSSESGHLEGALAKHLAFDPVETCVGRVIHGRVIRVWHGRPPAYS